MECYFCGHMAERDLLIHDLVAPHLWKRIKYEGRMMKVAYFSGAFSSFIIHPSTLAPAPSHPIRNRFLRLLRLLRQPRPPRHHQTTRKRMSEPNQFLLYTAPDGAVKVDVFFKDETVWLTQKALAELFGVQRPAITKHLGNIFATGELAEGSVCSVLEHTAQDGKNYSAKYYNLDAIIAVGYRVNSYQATQFRIWATKTLREFIIKGFVLDDERLKQGKQAFGKDYFDELLERIREIRTSERRFYQKITDIYALSLDYSVAAPLTKDFFASVQNKLHWAITGQTAAELIYGSADATKICMGLTTWRHAPSGKILKSDVAVAKNYLSEAHVKELNRLLRLTADSPDLLAIIKQEGKVSA